MVPTPSKRKRALAMETLSILIIPVIRGRLHSAKKTIREEYTGGSFPEF
jgi:hypothetical protein